MKSIENIVLIIIDQLRADYIKYLPRCSRVLPYAAVCDTDSIPASTEPMHTNISTGTYPKTHGFVSKIAKEGRKGLDQLINKLQSTELGSLASLANLNSFPAHILGGKQETVMVMGLPKECELMLYYDRSLAGFVAEGRLQSMVDRNFWPKAALVIFPM